MTITEPNKWYARAHCEACGRGNRTLLTEKDIEGRDVTLCRLCRRGFKDLAKSRGVSYQRQLMQVRR